MDTSSTPPQPTTWLELTLQNNVIQRKFPAPRCCNLTTYYVFLFQVFSESSSCPGLRTWAQWEGRAQGHSVTWGLLAGSRPSPCRFSLQAAPGTRQEWLHGEEALGEEWEIVSMGFLRSVQSKRGNQDLWGALACHDLIAHTFPSSASWREDCRFWLFWKVHLRSPWLCPPWMRVCAVSVLTACPQRAAENSALGVGVGVGRGAAERG